LHADDLADALIFLLSVDNPPDWINVGSGTDQSILELANLVKSAVGFEGEIQHDLSKPDGTPIKRLDVTLLEQLGWQSKISLVDGIQLTYEDFLESEKNGNLRI
jgi:GDP-L-fucose synthase